MSAADCTPCSAGLHPPNQWPAAPVSPAAAGYGSEQRFLARLGEAPGRAGRFGGVGGGRRGWRASGPPFLALTHLFEDEVQRNKDCEPGNSGEKQVCDHEPPLEFPITLTFELAKMQGNGTRPRHYALRRRGNGMTLASLSGSSGSRNLMRVGDVYGKRGIIPDFRCIASPACPNPPSAPTVPTEISSTTEFLTVTGFAMFAILCAGSVKRKII